MNMSIDPFCLIVNTIDVSADGVRDEDEECPFEVQVQKPAVVAAPSKVSMPGSLFVYDLETVPDESRSRRPERKEVIERKIDVAAVLKSVETVKTEIGFGLTKSQAEDLLFQEQNGGKCRRGAIDALQSFIESGDTEMRNWKKLSLSPWWCRIVAMSIFHIGEPCPDVWLAKNLDQERELLSAFWKRHEGGRRCGYNISMFDDHVIAARSMLLGITPSRPLKTSRWSNSQRIDLMDFVTVGGSAPKLKDLVRCLGIKVPAGDVDGSMVLDMVDAGQWDELRDYSASDAVVEMELFHRLRSVIEI